MNQKVSFGLVTFLLSFSFQLAAQETLYPEYHTKGKPTFIHGQGGNSCGSFVEKKKPYNMNLGIHYQNMAWALGYLDARDTFNPYTVKKYDYDGLALWLEEYCKKHPIEPLVNSINEFYKFIGGRFPMSRDDSLWKHPPN